ncbi:universal stress protein [Natronorubrum texcoconense]|uniref:Nucleotide-binding universal stress protein, UspA family n=1 Tax=Natronorubrum texcoconense TaxID=1095776 RepID=A0A1G8XJA8_9EURY|nr:universal stress protein [Natronorubrum texcoconense]SDJ90708.1 Nucleotide-binding universal stress protein, UspA family [Natronorubrum texcoconense]
MSGADQAGPIRSILVATDGSAAADEALERALGLAEQTGASVHVLAVVDTTMNPMHFGVDDVDELQRTKKRLVDDLVATVGDRNVEIHGAIRRGRPANAILAYADENAIDTLVVGRTGRSRVADMLLGSTTDRLLREASIPVVVVPAGDTDDGDESLER